MSENGLYSLESVCRVPSIPFLHRLSVDAIESDDAKKTNITNIPEVIFAFDHIHEHPVMNIA